MMESLQNSLAAFSSTHILIFIFALVLLAILAGFALKRRQKKVEISENQSPQKISSKKEEVAASAFPSFFSRGLTRTREQLSQSLNALLNRSEKIDALALDELHEILFRADMGVKTVDYLIGKIRQRIGSSEQSVEGMKQILSSELFELLKSAEKQIIASKKPYVVLVVGVNGAGKTTTIAKMCAFFQKQGKTVMLGAADTYRAAAIEQLKVWGERLNVSVIAQKQGSDPAAVAYDAVKAAIAREVDVLLIDTAGRLQNKKELMDELAKIKRIIGRDLSDAPHDVLLVLDATTGQNAVSQMRIFEELTQVTGLVLTKLDGTAKGGVAIGLVNEFKKPIYFIGVGEGMDDLQPFNAAEFVSHLY